MKESSHLTTAVTTSASTTRPAVPPGAGGEFSTAVVMRNVSERRSGCSTETVRTVMSLPVVTATTRRSTVRAGGAGTGSVLSPGISVMGRRTA